MSTVVLAAGGDQAITLGTRESRNPGESQSRQRVEERHAVLCPPFFGATLPSH